MTDRLRYGLLATVLGAAGTALSVLGYLAASDPLAARLAASSEGLASLLTGLSFTALACAVVLHYGRRSAQLAAAYQDLHRATLQRERTEAALRESERFSRATLDAIDAQIAVLDADGVVMAVNRAWRAGSHPLLGDAGTCDVGSNYVTVCEGVRGDAAARVVAGLRAIVAGEREDYALEAEAPGGGRFVTRVTRFAGHGPLRLVVAHQDVTALARPAATPAPEDVPTIREARALADALERERAFLRRVIDLDRSVVFVKDREGRYTLANAAMAELRGVTVEEIVGRTDAEVMGDAALAAALRESDREVMDELVEQELPAVPFRDRAGAVRWYRVLKRPVTGPDGTAAMVLGIAVDVTERKQAESRLRASEESFRALADTMPAAVWVADESGRWLYANRQWRALSGLEEAASLGDGWLRAVHPEDAEDAAAACRQAVERAEALRTECRLRAADGTVRWVELHVKPLADGTGRVERCVGAALDVTHRRAAAAQLHARHAEVEQRLAERTRERDRLFTLSLDGIGVGDAARFTRVNPAFTDALGWTAEELTARPYLDLVHPDDRERAAREAERLAGGARVQLTSRFRHRDGGWRWLSVTAIPDAADRVYAIARDVTELRAAELERAHAAEEIRALYDEAPCGYHALDAAGTLAAVNATALAWLGYDRDELVGRRFVELLAPASAERFAAARAELEAGSAVRLDLDVVRKDGSLLPVSLVATTLRDADGRCIGSRGAMIDATECRRAEARVEALHETLARRAIELADARAKLDRTRQELGWVSESVAHDLRAPLGEIDGFARILSDGAGDRLDPAGQRCLGIIRENAGRMAALLEGLVAVSRLDGRALRRADVDMTALARAVVDEVRRLQPDRDVLVSVDGLAPAVGDPALIRQLLVHLVGNAFASTAKVAHACIDLGSVENERDPVYYVRDNGAGFDVRDARPTDLFEQLAGPGEVAGTAIGLAAVQRIVERHGGRVWAESRVGEGATFFFTLGGDAAVDAEARPASGA